MEDDRAELANAELVETLARVRPELRRILFAHRIPRKDLTRIVVRAVIELAVHWEVLEDRAQWLLAAVQFECLAYWQRRGQSSPGLQKHLPPRRGHEILVDDAGRSLDLDLLRAMLPVRRRRVLFGPAGPVTRLRLVLGRSDPAADRSPAS